MVLLTGTTRIEAAVLLRSEGLSLRQIAHHFGVSKPTVAKWLDQGRPKCDGCGTKLLAPAGDGICGMCREEMVAGLASPAPTSTFAVWFLLDCGHRSGVVVAALRAMRAGAPAPAVAEALASSPTSNQPAAAMSA